MKNNHPGLIIKATMKSEKLKQGAFARSINMQPSQVSEMLSGRRSITPAFCLALESAGIGEAESWLFMYVKHELHKLRTAAR